jgi:hypothetical protein
MADDSEDLVSQIKVTGGDESAAQIEQFGNKGAESFDKLAASAKKADAAVSKASDNIAQGSKKAAAGLQEVSNVKIDPAAARGLKDIQEGTTRLVESFKKTSEAIGRFTERVLAISAAGAAAGAGLAVAAKNIAKTVDGTSDSLEKQTTAQIDANNSQLNAITATINFNSQTRQLQKQFAQGTITFQDYRDKLRDINQSYTEQKRVAAQVEEATAAVKLENEKLQKTLKDRTAFNELVSTFGGPLTTSLISFGRVVETVRQGVVNAFGPGLAAVIDIISNTLGSNTSAIVKFFQEASGKLSTLIKTNGPAIQLFLENAGKAAASIFDGLIAAGPAILNFFNNTLAPAISGVVAGLTAIANTINSVFGTKLTAGFLVILLLLIQMSGAFKLFFALLTTGSQAVAVLGGIISTLGIIPFLGWLAVIAAVSAALFLLLKNVDWAAFAAAAQSAIGSIIQFFTNLVSAAVTGKDNIVNAFTAMVAFFAALPATIGGAFTTLWTTVVNLATAAVTAILTAFGTFVTFVQGLPDQIGALFVALGQTIVDSFNSAIDTVKNTLKGLLDAAISFLQPVIDMLTKIAQLTASSGGGGSGQAGPVAAASGGHIRGPGTSTSDSIPAWLSDNEFVVRAAAVRKYGVGLLNAINRGNFKMPKFSMGGLNMVAPAPRTHFAEGGSVRTSGLQALNLSLFGEDFTGLLMPDDVADKMTKFAIARQTRSAGRKPNWIGGNR